MSEWLTRAAACVLVSTGCSGTPQQVTELAEALPVVARPETPQTPSAPAAEEIARGAGCPTGMVRVSGVGTTGMRGDPYGVVHTRHMARVDAPERMCPDALSAAVGSSACWVQTDLVDPVLRPRAVSGPDFCIERAPFPGMGSPYPVDGMTAGTVAQLDAMLKTGRFGTRRLCTVTEYQLAVAGPSRNQRFIYGDRADSSICQAGRPIGSDRRCENPETGVLEYGAIHSHWVTADAAFVASACDAPPCLGAGSRPVQVGAYVVAGGTDRVQTRQAPLTPHTWHDHGEPADVGCSDEGWDDQVVICASPDPIYDSEILPSGTVASEAAWRAVVQATRQSGRITGGIAQGLGQPLCPDGR